MKLPHKDNFGKFSLMTQVQKRYKNIQGRTA